MSRPRSLGMTVLGIWLVAYGVQGLVPMLIPGAGLLLAMLALVAGLLILMGR
ncbi:MAG TPA: hypothetical protein VFQ51_00055 [Vicinamibacteria bacterium]|nr:hypothetical protein [Vicinamibacteria bacterium]